MVILKRFDDPFEISRGGWSRGGKTKRRSLLAVLPLRLPPRAIEKNLAVIISRQNFKVISCLWYFFLFLN